MNAIKTILSIITSVFIVYGILFTNDKFRNNTNIQTTTVQKLVNADKENYETEDEVTPNNEVGQFLSVGTGTVKIKNSTSATLTIKK